jgi:hypothetical protein
MSFVTTRPTVSPSTLDHRAGHSFRPWHRWLLTALAFPPAGLIAHLVAGRVDSTPSAVLAGLLTGTGIGAAQWALLRRRGVGASWIAATSAGLAAGLATGAAIVSYRTDITSLAVMGAVCGLAVGIAQGATLGNARRALGWTAATSALWSLGWFVTTAGGIDVSQQWPVFGAYGCFTLALLQSTIVSAFVPAKAVAS